MVIKNKKKEKEKDGWAETKQTMNRLLELSRRNGRGPKQGTGRCWRFACACVCACVPWRRQVVVWSDGCCWLHGSVPCHLCIDYSWAGSLQVPEGASSAANGPKQNKKGGRGRRKSVGYANDHLLSISPRLVRAKSVNWNCSCGGKKKERKKINYTFKRYDSWKEFIVCIRKSIFFLIEQVFVCTHSYSSVMWLNKQTHAFH